MLEDAKEYFDIKRRECKALTKELKALRKAFDELNASHESLKEDHEELNKAHKKLEKAHSSLLNEQNEGSFGRAVLPDSPAVLLDSLVK
jgi:prefoldin subunit 5